MFNFHKINPKSTTEINTGFGINSSDYGGRFLNKNGEPNIEKKGLGYFERISWYHVLLKLPRWKFLVIILLFYFFINLLFGLFYFILGVTQFAGIPTHTAFEEFAESFFFSCQTFTTVGYGRISPIGFFASLLSSFEALMGLLSFAVVTGLLYGRFSRPKAYVRFSENALLSPYHNGNAIMLRLAPFKNTTLTDAEAKVSLGLIVEENGKKTNKFFQLSLEYEKVNSLTLNWTIVHPVTETSPFYNFTLDDFRNAQGEILVYVKAFDHMFSNVVVARTSYTLNEVITGAVFEPMYHRSANAKNTVLNLNKLNSFSKTSLNHNHVIK